MWTNKAIEDSKKALEGGSIFGSLEDLGARKIKDIILGEVYELGRFEVFLKTENYKDPYVTFELNGTFYSGYARAIGNQLYNMATKAAKDPANQTTVTDTKAFTEIPVGMPVIFTEESSSAGTYRQMAFYDANSEGDDKKKF